MAHASLAQVDGRRRPAVPRRPTLRVVHEPVRPVGTVTLPRRPARIPRPGDPRRWPAPPAAPRPVAIRGPREVGVGVDRGPETNRGRDAAPLRLTPRGRRVVLALTVAAALASGALAGGLDQDPGLRLAGGSEVVVQAGDTLWGIATTVAGDEDVRSVVDRIQALNGLSGGQLHPGQTLRLP